MALWALDQLLYGESKFITIIILIAVLRIVNISVITDVCRLASC